MTISTLGHKGTRLGSLYSAVENKFLTSMSLWPAEFVDKHKSVIHHPIQETKWTSPQTFSEKAEMLKIDVYGSVTVSVEIAKIEASGSFNYLQNKKVNGGNM